MEGAASTGSMIKVWSQITCRVTSWEMQLPAVGGHHSKVDSGNKNADTTINKMI